MAKAKKLPFYVSVFSLWFKRLIRGLGFLMRAHSQGALKGISQFVIGGMQIVGNPKNHAPRCGCILRSQNENLLMIANFFQSDIIVLCCHFVDSFRLLADLVCHCKMFLLFKNQEIGTGTKLF